jgi:2-polyprenyl-3-methyl-5-hydroxy-6-metoxy-1,4-benzoquinol methylase
MHSIKDTWLDWYKDRKVEENVIAFAQGRSKAGDRRILDFGTGTGRHTLYLAKMGFDVYGFDWSHAAIDATKQELARQGLSANLTVWDMNENPLPYEDKFFDAVVAVRVLHHTYMEMIRRIASEISRITKVGGHLYLETPTYEEVLTQKSEGLRFEEPEPGTFIPLNGREVGVPHHHFRQNEVIAVFSDFKLVSFEENQGHYCFTGMRK